jgi:phospholipid/cholesterol/gamma-HCH transport system substrate-binding protein
MIARLVAIVLVAAAIAAVVVASGDDQSERPRYTIELDNAFGLVVGGDVRVAGVNAGRVTSIDLDERTKKALVKVEITQRGFGSFRSDVYCESRPQSPLGEYFVDCVPGTARKALRPGSHVPVGQTASTIPPDLIANIMRVPYRERLRLVLMELGAGLAGRPDDLNAAIRRAVPALRQSDRVLEILAEHRREIRDLVHNADRVVGDLAANRRNVGRFVVEARDTASASAERSDDIATNFRKLPRFLQELRPTLAALGEASDEERPVLVDLSASAGQLKRFLDLSGDFATASRPAFRALGGAAEVGRETVREGRPRVDELRRYARPTVDLGQNLAIVLDDFDDQGRAVERDPRSPGGRGYSGTQAVLRYLFAQGMTVNGFDQLGHYNRSAVFGDQCSPYTDAKTLKSKPSLIPECASWLGPNQAGITKPDFNVPPRDPQDPYSGGSPSSRAAARTLGGGRDKGRDGRDEGSPSRDDGAAGGSSGDGGGGGGGHDRSALERLLDEIDHQHGGGPPPAPNAPDGLPLLDYLLGP